MGKKSGTWFGGRSGPVLPLLLAWALWLSAAGARAEGTVTNVTLENFYGALIGGGLVKFQASGSIPLRETIVFRRDTTLDASGFSVAFSGAGTNRLLTVSTGVNLTLVNLVLIGAKSDYGSALLNEGGNVFATNCVFATNTVTVAAGAAGAAGADDNGMGHDGGNGVPGQEAVGGAIFNLGNLRLDHCRFIANKAVAGAGGAGGNGGNGAFAGGDGGDGAGGGLAYGGAIYSAGSLDVMDCSFDGNIVTGGDGGAGGKNGSGAFESIPGHGGPGGHAMGAAIYSLSGASILRTSFITNAAGAGKAAAGGSQANGAGMTGLPGGAALGGAVYSAGRLTLVNCTLAGNHVDGGAGGAGGAGPLVGGDGGDGGTASGGGISNFGTAGITNCTFALNAAKGGAAGAAGAGWTPGEAGGQGASIGSALANHGAQLSLKNTLLAASASGVNAYGAVLDLGHNLSSDGSCSFTAATSRNSVDAKLGTLGRHDGWNDVFSLAYGSPAIGAGEPLPDVATDQRGVVRPADVVDIGAFQTATPDISGKVIWKMRVPVGSTNYWTNVPLPDLLISLFSFSDTTNTVATDTNGFFRFRNQPPDYYRVVPDLSRFQTTNAISPTQYVVHLQAFAITNCDFTISERFAAISGKVATTNWITAGGAVFVTNVPVASLTMRLLPSAGATNTTTTDTNGSYVFPNLPPDSYRVVPDLTRFQTTNVISPTQHLASLEGLAITNLDFSIAERLGLISGRITTRSWITVGASRIVTNLPLGGLTVLLSSEGATNAVVTDTNGVYRFSDLHLKSFAVRPVVASQSAATVDMLAYMTANLSSSRTNADFEVSERLSLSIPASPTNQTLLSLAGFPSGAHLIQMATNLPDTGPIPWEPFLTNTTDSEGWLRIPIPFTNLPPSPFFFRSIYLPPNP